ncbi:MAG: XdhC family protein [Candidatus Aminicenantes bacterium]
MKNIYDRLFFVMEKKKQAALATIIETEGSTPQVPGASAIFSSEGLLAGTLGGGLLEADCQKRTLQALKEKRTFVHQFDLNAGLGSDEGAVCGGRVKILVDSSPEQHRETFRRLHQSFTKRRPGLLVTFIEHHGDKGISVFRKWIENGERSFPVPEIPVGWWKKQAARAFSERQTLLLKLHSKERRAGVKGKYLFLEPIFPLAQLVIAGAGHVGRAVAHLGSVLDFEVTVIDDRPEFANKDHIPDADHVVVEEMGKAVKNFPFTSDTYLVIVTRGHRQDGEVLRESIASPAAYIGMIGSRRKIELIRKSFLQKGWATARQFDRVHAPIGLEIGSKTVEEIAVSIAAQLVQVRSQKRKEQT